MKIREINAPTLVVAMEHACQVTMQEEEPEQGNRWIAYAQFWDRVCRSYRRRAAPELFCPPPSYAELEEIYRLWDEFFAPYELPLQ
jgi:hypothetical protein